MTFAPTRRLASRLGGLALGLLLTAAPAVGQTIQKVALVGEAAPGAAGTSPTFLGFGTPAVNGAGQVLVQGFVPNPTTPSGAVNGVWVWTAGVGPQFVAQVQGAAPGTGGLFTQFDSTPILDDSGRVAFWATATGSSKPGVWSGPAGGLGLVARMGNQAPGFESGVTIENTDIPKTLAVNAGGQVAFHAYLNGPGIGFDTNSTIWVGPPGGSTLTVRGGDPAPGLVADAVFSAVGSPLIGRDGTLTFAAGVSGTGLTNANNSTLWVKPAGAAPQLVVRTGTQMPGIESGLLLTAIGSGFSAGDDRRVYFTGYLGSTSNDIGVWAGRPGELQLVARENRQAPGLPDGVVFKTLVFGDGQINRSGHVAFLSELAGTGVTTANDKAVWAGSPGALRAVVREGDRAPGTGDGVVFAFTSGFNPRPALAGGGQVAFRSELAGTGVGTTNNLGVWIGDLTGEMLKVVRTGDLFPVGPGDNRTVKDILYYGPSGGQDGRSAAVNDAGQLPLNLTFADDSKGVFLWTPDLQWRPSGAGADAWDNNQKWTLSLNPAAAHKVTIAPAAATTVAGPTGTTAARSLQLGGGAGRVTLVTQPGSTLTTTGGLTVADKGVLAGTGTVGGPVRVGFGGRLAPGAGGAGTLRHTGAMIWNAGGEYEVEYGRNSGPSVAGTDHDLLSSTGSLTLAADPYWFVIRLKYTGPVAEPDDRITLRIARFDGGVTGFDPARFEFEGDFEGAAPTVALVDLGGGARAIDVTFTPVPEPAGVLAVVGLALAAAWRRRRGRPRGHLGGL